MKRLRDFQTKFQRFVAGRDSAALLEYVIADAPGLAERLSVYRNNFLVSHTTALSHLYPVVRLLVDARFFAFAAHNYLRDSPPRTPCMSDFGGDFPEFLATFPPAAGISYIADVARLEWAISRVCMAGSISPLSVRALIDSGRDPAEMRLDFHPALRFVNSPYPVDVIWQLHQSGPMSHAIQLEAEEVHLEVGGIGLPLLRRCQRSQWRFRALVADGFTLGQAVEAALKDDDKFDVDHAVRTLFENGLIIGIRCDDGPVSAEDWGK